MGQQLERVGGDTPAPATVRANIEEPRVLKMIRTVFLSIGPGP